VRQEDRYKSESVNTGLEKSRSLKQQNTVKYTGEEIRSPITKEIESTRSWRNQL